MTDITPLDTPTPAAAAEPVLVDPLVPVMGCPVILTEAGAAAEAAWERFASDEHLAPVTRANYAHQAALFLNGLPAQSVGLIQITPTVVNEFLATRPYACTALRRLFGVLVAHGVVTDSPIASTRLRYKIRVAAAGVVRAEGGDGPVPGGSAASEPERVEGTGEKNGPTGEPYSKRAFVRYWDGLIASGEVTPETGRSRKSVSLRYLELLPEALQRDLRLVNIDEAIREFESHYASYFQHPATIDTYKYRFRDAVTRFLAHAHEPTPSAPANPAGGNRAVGDDTLIVRLGETLVVKLMGMPHELNRQQADKLHRLIDAYVVGDGLG